MNLRCLLFVPDSSRTCSRSIEYGLDRLIKDTAKTQIDLFAVRLISPKAFCALASAID